MPDDEIHPALKENAADLSMDIGGRVADLVLPGFGSKFLDVLIGQVVPRRNERFALFMTDLSRRLRVIEEGQKGGDIEWTAPKQALFEDGARVAARSTTEETIEGVARLVADGITAGDVEAMDNHQILALVAELSADDIIVLTSFSPLIGSQPKWRERHRALLDPMNEEPQPEEKRINPNAITDEQRERMRREDANALSDHRLAKLERLGLLGTAEDLRINEGRPNIQRRRSVPKLTNLGRIVLVRLGKMPRYERMDTIYRHAEPESGLS